VSGRAYYDDRKREYRCEFQLYLLVMVSPCTLSDVIFFIIESCVVIVQLHMCFLLMCKRTFFGSKLI